MEFSLAARERITGKERKIVLEQNELNRTANFMRVRCKWILSIGLKKNWKATTKLTYNTTIFVVFSKTAVIFKTFFILRKNTVSNYLERRKLKMVVSNTWKSFWKATKAIFPCYINIWLTLQKTNRVIGSSWSGTMTTEDLRQLEKSVSLLIITLNFVALTKNFKRKKSIWLNRAMCVWTSIVHFFHCLFDSNHFTYICIAFYCLFVCFVHKNRFNVPAIIWIRSKRDSHRSKRHCYLTMMWWTVFRWWKSLNRWLKWRMNIKICTKTSKRWNNCNTKWPPHCNINCERWGQHLNCSRNDWNYELSLYHRWCPSRLRHRHSIAKCICEGHTARKPIQLSYNENDNKNAHDFQRLRSYHSIEFYFVCYSNKTLLQLMFRLL